MNVAIYKENESAEYSGILNVKTNGTHCICQYNLNKTIDNSKFISGHFEIDNPGIAPIIKKLHEIVNFSKSHEA